MVYPQWLWKSLVSEKAPASTALTTTTGGQEKHSHANAVPSSAGLSPINGNIGHDSTRPDTKPNTTTLRILDVVTSVQSSLVSLLHFWLFKNLKIAYLLAVTAW
jgi:hypothetical protein